MSVWLTTIFSVVIILLGFAFLLELVYQFIKKFAKFEKERKKIKKEIENKEDKK
nr:hypothetical protein [Spiroplasma poulsonii]